MTENRNCSCNYNINMEAINNIGNMPINSCEDNNMTREKLMKKIKSYQFAVTDIGLYLDTHSEDERALCLHKRYSKELKELQDKYQKVYGPLTINFPCNKWRWIEEPWPWERGND